jgi:hypothetical protein
MPGSSPARAFKRNWYCRPHLVSAEDIEQKRTLTHPTQTKLAHHTTSTASSRTTIFDCRRSRVAAKGIQLQLGLVAHLGRETLVACNVKVCASRDFVVGDALSRFDVAQDACIWSGRHLEGNGISGKPENKQATTSDFDPVPPTVVAYSTKATTNF